MSVAGNRATRSVILPDRQTDRRDRHQSVAGLQDPDETAVEFWIDSLDVVERDFFAEQ